MNELDILNPIFKLCNKVWNKRKWSCDFCGISILPFQTYFWVRKKPNFTATLKACKNCANKRLMFDLGIDLK